MAIDAQLACAFAAFVCKQPTAIGHHRQPFALPVIARGRQSACPKQATVPFKGRERLLFRCDDDDLRASGSKRQSGWRELLDRQRCQHASGIELEVGGWLQRLLL